MLVPKFARKSRGKRAKKRENRGDGRHFPAVANSCAPIAVPAELCIGIKRPLDESVTPASVKRKPAAVSRNFGRKIAAKMAKNGVKNAAIAAVRKEKRDGEEGHHPGPLPASAHWLGGGHVTARWPISGQQSERHRPAGATAAPVDTAPLSLNDVSGAAPRFTCFLPR